MPGKEILIYQTEDGRRPFNNWLTALSPEARTKIKARLERVGLGLLGDYKNIGLGVFELRIHWGPGYRIYFGFDGKTFIILLCGGDKSAQFRDIEKAHAYWQDYLRRKR
jgi:putative addiction module killer protein